MISKLEGQYHWVSIGCMGAAMAMICAGHTAIEPALQQSGAALSMVYWAFSAAFTVATVGFAYLALLNAHEHINAMEARAAVKAQAQAPSRLNTPKHQHPANF